MNEQKKQKLLEQYDDAAFALLMDEYAETEGARLMAEFEAAQAAGQVPEMPQELDEQCRRMIRRDRVKKRGRRAAHSFRRVAVKAAVAVLVFIGLMTTLVMSVDALRIPILNYFIEHSEKYSTLELYQNETQILPDFDLPDTNPNDYLIQFLPEGYTSVYYYDDGGLINSGYQNQDGSTIYFDMMPGTAMYQFDTENATYDYIVIGGLDVILVEKEGFQAVWTNTDQSIIFSITASDLSRNEVIDFLTEIINIWG